MCEIRKHQLRPCFFARREGNQRTAGYPGKYVFHVHWPNSLGLIQGFCTVGEQPWVDLNPQPFALKATTLTSALRRPDIGGGLPDCAIRVCAVSSAGGDADKWSVALAGGEPVPIAQR